MSYNEGKIYKIVSNQTDMIYIGSTIQTLEDRFSQHKCDYKKNRAICSSIELLKYDDCKIVLIESFPCLSRPELERREGEIQLENIIIIVNHNIAGRTRAEWYAENKDDIADYSAQYYLDNIDKIAKYRMDNKENINKRMAQYRMDNKEKNTQWRLDNNDYITQYYLDNKEKIAKQRAKRYQDNKEKIAQRAEHFE
jgi:hypothetical protein